MSNLTPTEHFLAKIQAEPALAAKLQATNYKSAAEFSAVVIALAAEHNIALTTADLDAWLKDNTPPPASADCELSDAQLDSVAGGKPVYVLNYKPNTSG